MKSISTKIILLNIIAISVSITVATVIGAVSIARFGHESAEKELALYCETGKNNVNYYLKSVEQSVNTVSSLFDSSLDELPDLGTSFSTHIEEARTIFKEAALNTNGVLTYYYRIDPNVSSTKPGFWYTNLDGKGFIEHEVTDLTDEQYSAVWFRVPRETGQAVWLPPYVTDNLDVYVISYNVPVYRNVTQFVGVVGIEISYTTLGQQISNIKPSNSGYAYIVENTNGSIIYHPNIDILSMDEKDRPSIPGEFLVAFKNGEHHSEYTFQGVRKHSYWMNLSNNMSIVVAVPFNEVNRTWISMITLIIIAAIVIVALFVVSTIFFSKRITKPLKELTEVAEEINTGNYQVKFDYNEDDEIGILAGTVNKLINNLDGYITDLNKLAYADALTSIHNKNAFDMRMDGLQNLIDNADVKPEFAIVMLDCDNLKDINDEFGHDKGDIYLRSSVNLMSNVFSNSLIYRIGGDEFAIILEGEDYSNRDKLIEQFHKKGREIYSFAKNPWEQIKVSIGVAAYDPTIDRTANDVMIHADHLMYQNKRSRKKGN